MNPCQCGGKCVSVPPSLRHPGSTSFTCQCPATATGPLCELPVDPCESNPCAPQQSVCQSVAPASGSNSSSSTYRCVCAAGFTGALCDQALNSCASAPCQNGGLCQSLSGAFVCQCAANFYGITCQHEYACVTQPCSAQGTAQCVDVTAAPKSPAMSYVCNCLPGYTGKLCDTQIDACQSNPCQNNGTCLTLSNGLCFNFVNCALPY